MNPLHLSADDLSAGLAEILCSPGDEGPIAMIVRRPDVGTREQIESGQLDVDDGLIGDNWKTRGLAKRPPKPPNMDAQLTLMNARAAQLIARERDRWPLAGDQIYVDLDLSEKNLPAGTRLSIGAAIIEISAEPHTGCKKFVQRFGLDAMKFVNDTEGRAHRLRGVNARIVQSGAFAVGDRIKRL